jgi:hypothetical protein
MLPEPNSEFECFSVQHVLPFLVENGYGVAVNPTESGADWIFSYGDIWNFWKTGAFYSDTLSKSAEKNVDQDVNANREVLLAQPSEDFLPPEVRKVISEVLSNSFKIPCPSVFLIIDPSTEPSQSLAINVFRENFEEGESGDHGFEHTMAFLTWCLPGHYGVAGIEKDHQMSSNFLPL